MTGANVVTVLFDPETANGRSQLPILLKSLENLQIDVENIIHVVDSALEVAMRDFDRALNNASNNGRVLVVLSLCGLIDTQMMLHRMQQLTGIDLGGWTH